MSSFSFTHEIKGMNYQIRLNVLFKFSCRQFYLHKLLRASIKKILLDPQSTSSKVLPCKYSCYLVVETVFIEPRTYSRHYSIYKYNNEDVAFPSNPEDTGLKLIYGSVPTFFFFLQCVYGIHVYVHRHVSAYVWVHVCVSVRMCANTCGGMKLMVKLFLKSPATLFTGAESLKPRACQYGQGCFACFVSQLTCSGYQVSTI